MTENGQVTLLQRIVTPDKPVSKGQFISLLIGTVVGAAIVGMLVGAVSLLLLPFQVMADVTKTLQ